MVNQSHNREEDRKARVSILEAMQTAVRTGNLNDAKELGTSAKTLAGHIASKDYSREDCWLEMEKQAFKAKEPHCSCGYHAAVNNDWKPLDPTQKR